MLYAVNGKNSANRKQIRMGILKTPSNHSVGHILLCLSILTKHVSTGKDFILLGLAENACHTALLRNVLRKICKVDFTVKSFACC